MPVFENSFWKPYSRQKVNNKWIFLKIEPVHGSFENRQIDNCGILVSQTGVLGDTASCCGVSCQTPAQNKHIL